VDRRADEAAGPAPAPAPAPAPELPGDVVSSPSFADDPGRTQPMSALPHEGEERA
jgi:hypothetical protein